MIEKNIFSYFGIISLNQIFEIILRKKQVFVTNISQSSTDTGQNVTLRHSTDSFCSSISYYRIKQHIQNKIIDIQLQIDLVEYLFSLQKIHLTKIVLHLMYNRQMWKNKYIHHFLNLI